MRNSGDVDRDYPQGSPDAVFCRWCKDPRVVRKGALICDYCDSPQPLK